MTAYAAHTLVAFGGILNTGADVGEIWQCGIRVTDVVGGGPLADHDAYLAGIQAALSTWFSAAGTVGLPSTSNLMWIKANGIAPNGKYSSDTTHVYDYPAAVAGGDVNVANFKTDIISLVLSWTTAKARGKSHAGRIYLPNYSVDTQHPGSVRTLEGTAAAWAQKGKTLLGVLANGAVHAVPIVASSAGPTAQITGVRVGDVMDVQRRRKDAYKEVYSAVAFAPA